MGLKIPVTRSQNSLLWVSKIPSFGPTPSPFPTRQHVPLRHLDRYLEEPVERVGRVLPLAAVLQRLAAVDLVQPLLYAIFDLLSYPQKRL